MFLQSGFGIRRFIRSRWDFSKIASQDGSHFAPKDPDGTDLLCGHPQLGCPRTVPQTGRNASWDIPDLPSCSRGAPRVHERSPSLQHICPHQAVRFTPQHRWRNGDFSLCSSSLQDGGLVPAILPNTMAADWLGALEQVNVSAV